MSVVADTVTVFVRALRPTLANPVGLGFSLAQPLIMVLLFGPLLAEMPVMASQSPWQWFVPGILVMIGVTGTLGTGANLLFEMASGAHERLLVTPLHRSSLMIGRALNELLPLVLQAILIIIAVLPMGFRLYPLGALLGLALLGVFGIGLGALSFTLALVSKGRESLFWVVSQSLTFPLLILSGMLLPLELGPAWMRALSLVNPLTYIVNAERALFSGDLTNPSVPHGVLAAFALAAVGLLLGIRTMRRA